MEVPHCKRCGQFHYRFVACDNVISWNEKHAEKKARQAGPPVENWRVPEGFRRLNLARPNNVNIGSLPTPPGFHSRGASNGPPEAA